MPHSGKSSARMRSRRTGVLMVTYRRSSIVWSRSTLAQRALRVLRRVLTETAATDGTRKNLFVRMQSVETVGTVDTFLDTWRLY
jgi:hypothetical protein